MAIRMPLDAFGADEGDGVSEQAVKFHELWQHRAALHDLCQRIVGDAATADDVVQETYMRALRNLDRLERRPSLMPWLATVARRRSIDELRRRRYQTPVEVSPDDSTKPELDPGESVAVSETVERVREALTTLTPRERELLVRQVNHGMSLAELASEDDSSVASVRSVLSRARTKLRTALTDAGMQVLAPIFLFGGWFKRKVGPAASRAHHVTAVPAGYERFAETLVAGVAAAGLALGGLPGLGATADGVAAPEVEVVTEGAGSLSPVPPVSFSTPAVAGDPVRLITSGESSEEAPPSDDRRDDAPARSGLLPRPDHAKAPGPAGDVRQSAQHERSVPDPEPRNPLQQPAATVPEDTAVDAFGHGASGARGTSTTYALGRTCGSDSCSVLWRSDDGGRSWERLRAEGLQAHTLLVSPDVDETGDIYAVGTTGVQVSTDGGEHFQVVLGPAYNGPAAMSPGFAGSDTHKYVYLGAAPNWRFNAASRLATPLGMGLPGNTANFAFHPDFPSTKRMYAGTVTLDTATPAVFVCDDGWCPGSSAVEFPDLTAAPDVAVADSDPSVVLAWSGTTVYRSADAGATFAPLVLPATGSVTGFSDDGDGRLYLSVADGGADAGAVLRSTDGGVTWQALGRGTALEHGARAVSAVGNGLVFASPLTEAGGGVLCSVNDGTTWSRRC